MKDIKFYNKHKNEHIKFINRINGDGEIEIDGGIGVSMFDWGYTFEQFKFDLSQLKGEIIINIKSYGGDLHEALAIHDYIRSLDNRVVTKIVGATASSGTIISFAGDERLISKNSQYLIHKPMITSMGNSDDYEKILSMLQDLDKQLVELYAERSKLSKEEILDLMTQDKWISAEKALEYGFVDGYINEKSTKKSVSINNENNENQNINDMDAKLLKLLNVATEEEAIAKVQEIVDSKLDETPENQVEETTETPENITETPENSETEEVENSKEEEVENSETEEEVENSEEEEVENKEDEEDDVEALKARIAELEKELEEKEADNAENVATQMENLINDAIVAGRIDKNSKETWMEIGDDKGLFTLTTLINAIPLPSNDKKLSNLIKSQEFMSGKQDIINKWKKGEITTKDYLNLMKTVKK